ncbi:MAG: hypothetical protein H0U66_09715 [Gemmatimonadaceae bacterium]|nr:hypothetical protein [Gemmatimonadaceae bacterium]
MSDRIEILCEVNEVGTVDGVPRATLVVDRASVAAAAKRKAGVPDRETWLENVAELQLSREQARWFGARLYRKVRVTFEDAGPLDADESEAIRADKQMTLDDLRALGAEKTGTDDE